MADRTKGSDSGDLGKIEGPEMSEAFETPSSSRVTSSAHRQTPGTRSNRSRRKFNLAKLRLSLTIDADCASTGERTAGTGESTPASTCSSCSSDVVPWWEVEYQCPPPGHLGAHVVPVSAIEAVECSSTAHHTSAFKSIETTKRAETNRTCHLSVSLSTPILTQTSIRPGAVLYETPEPSQQGRHSKLSTLMTSAPRLLVDNSPSLKRKVRAHDPTDCTSDLFSTPVTKQRKQSYEFSLQKSALLNQVVAPSTLAQPLTPINKSMNEVREAEPASTVLRRQTDAVELL